MLAGRIMAENWCPCPSMLCIGWFTVELPGYNNSVCYYHVDFAVPSIFCLCSRNLKDSKVVDLALYLRRLALFP